MSHVTPPAVVFSVDPGNTSGYASLTVCAEPGLVGVSQINFKLKREKRSACSVVQDFAERWHQAKWNFVTHPVIVAIEDQYLAKKGDPRRNIDSLKKLSRNAGRWEDAACHCGFEFEYFNPSIWITAELGKNLRSAQIEKLARQKVYALYGHRIGRELTGHECCAILIGRYVAISEWRKAMGTK